MTPKPNPVEMVTAPQSIPREVLVVDSPLRDDSVTIACPRCGRDFHPSGRRRFCSAACRQAAFRRRQPISLPTLPALVPRSAIIYQCPACDTRLLGQQRCPECGVFCRRLGPGGPCPHCEEPVALADLLGAGN